MSRIAVFDLGTNTFNMLVAECKDDKVAFVFRKKIGVALGHQLLKSGVIQSDAIQRAILALQEFKKSADKHNCAKIYAFATAAFRNAKNKEEVLLKIKTEVDLHIEIISGKEEALAISKAALHELNTLENALILDIGGGSIELISCKKNKPQKLESFPLGVTRLLEMHTWSDPLSASDEKILENHFETTCGSFFKEVYQPILVGAAGIFETLATEIQPPPPFHGPEDLNFTSVKMCLKSWLSSTYLSRETKSEIIPVRRKTLHVAAALLLWILKKADVEKIIATPNSLAEGKALEYFEKLGVYKR